MQFSYCFRKWDVLVPIGFMCTFHLPLYYMQMTNRQIRSRKFIVGIDQVVQLTTADNSDSSDGDDPIDEEDIIQPEEATP